MTTQLILRGAIGGFLKTSGLGELVSQFGEQPLEVGIATIAIELEHIALEVEASTLAGRSLAQACNDQVNCPRLFKLHTTLRDLLTLEMPAPLLEWARSCFKNAETIGDDLQAAVSRTAIAEKQPPAIRALARLMLFEWLRFSLILLDHLPQVSRKILPKAVGRESRKRFGFIAADFDDVRIDELAEEQVAWWLGQARSCPSDVRPLHVLLASALLDIQKEAKSVEAMLALVESSVAEERRRLAEVDRRMQRMNTPDALLIRNAAGLGPDGQRLTMETLQEQHPVAFNGRTRNALDQQFFRLCRSIEKGEWPQRSSPAVVDLVAKAIEEIE